jgi:hypothetical protein
LRYVVNETLEGRAGHLKERALGVEVFNRDPDYDTNADPVVRTSACEVRKRIAQYYHEPGHESEIRIDLPSGSYIPEFRFSAHGADTVEAEKRGPFRLFLFLREGVRQTRVQIVLAMIALAILATGAAESLARPNAVESFWGPVWAASDSVMMGLGPPPAQLPPPSTVTNPDLGPSYRDTMRADALAFSDALTMARITGLTREYSKKKLDVRRATAFTLTDLRKGPSILVGAFNNSWTMRLDHDLRFTYVWNNETHTGCIRDRQNPNNRSWIHDPSLPYSQLTQDYAVVSRFMDPLTEKMLVVVGGMGRDGTIAAGEFVTEPRYLEKLAAQAPRHWDRMNLQVVLATDVVRGNTGPPRILAVHFW